MPKDIKVSGLRFWTQALAGLMFAPAVSAAEAPSQSARSALPPAIDEIIVTATKRETPLSLTPLSITAISGERLDELGQRDFDDYFRQVPGLTAVDGGPGRKTYILRGISGQSSGMSQAVVAQYVDEVPITNSFGLQPDPRLVDIDRIEVLRGPQGGVTPADAQRHSYGSPRAAGYPFPAAVQIAGERHSHDCLVPAGSAACGQRRADGCHGPAVGRTLYMG